MKTYIVIILNSIILMSCSGVMPDEPLTDEECMELQNALNLATDFKLRALEDYTKDPDNHGICTQYVEALEDRIAKAKKMIITGCLVGFVLDTTIQSITEDENELNRLGGC